MTVTEPVARRYSCMDRWLGLCPALLVVSCSGSTAGLKASPSQSPYTSTSPTGLKASPSQSPSASTSPTAPLCRLPVMLWNYPDGETQGGFINSGSGVFTPDPSSVMVLDIPSGLIRTPDKPYLLGSRDANFYSV